MGKKCEEQQQQTSTERFCERIQLGKALLALHAQAASNNPLCCAQLLCVAAVAVAVACWLAGRAVEAVQRVLGHLFCSSDLADRVLCFARRWQPKEHRFDGRKDGAAGRDPSHLDGLERATGRGVALDAQGRRKPDDICDARRARCSRRTRQHSAAKRRHGRQHVRVAAAACEHGAQERAGSLWRGKTRQRSGLHVAGRAARVEEALWRKKREAAQALDGPCCADGARCGAGLPWVAENKALALHGGRSLCGGRCCWLNDVDEAQQQRQQRQKLAWCRCCGAHAQLRRADTAAQHAARREKHENGW